MLNHSDQNHIQVYAPHPHVAGARIDTGVDVFSFGVIMWELVCSRGQRPYRELALDAIGDAVASGTRLVFPNTDHVPSAYRYDYMYERCTRMHKLFQWSKRVALATFVCLVFQRFGEKSRDFVMIVHEHFISFGSCGFHVSLVLCPTPYRQLAKSCWARDARQRPSAAELVNAIKALLEAVKS